MSAENSPCEVEHSSIEEPVKSEPLVVEQANQESDSAAETTGLDSSELPTQNDDTRSDSDARPNRPIKLLQGFNPKRKLKRPPFPNEFDEYHNGPPAFRPRLLRMAMPPRMGMRPMMRPDGNLMRPGFPPHRPRPFFGVDPRHRIPVDPYMGGRMGAPLEPSAAMDDGLLPIPRGFARAPPRLAQPPAPRMHENDPMRMSFPHPAAGMTLLPAPAARPMRPMVNPSFPEQVLTRPDNDPFMQAPMTNEIEQISRFLQNREYQRLHQFIRDNVREGYPIPPPINQAVIFATRELTCQLAFPECFQMFRSISNPTIGMLEALTDMVTSHADRLRNNEMDVWLPFNKSITWHISTRTQIPCILIDTMVRCFSALSSFSRVWGALQLCHQSNCLPPACISKTTLERLLDAMLYENTDVPNGSAQSSADGPSATGISLNLAIHLLEPYLPPLPGSNIPPNPDTIRCDILVRVWLRCVIENESDWAHRVGGPGGTLLISVPKLPMTFNVPPPTVLPHQQIQDRETVLSVLRNRIAELIVNSNYNGVVQIMVFGYHFLPELADAFVTNLLLVADTHKAFTSLMKLAHYKIQGNASMPTLPAEVNRCLAYVCLQLAHSFSERRQWAVVVQLHESVITSQQGNELLMSVLPTLSPNFGVQYPLTIIEAALKLKKFSLARIIMQTFSIFSHPIDDPSFRSRRYIVLRDLIEVAIIENDLESAIDIFWILQGIFDNDAILECPADVNEIFNDLIVRSCKAGGDNTRRALELGRRGMAFAKTRLVVLAFPLRVLMTEAVRQGCCSAVDASTTGNEMQNKECVFDLAERGFQVAIYPRPEVRMTDLSVTQNLFIPTDATTEEIHVLLTIYCRMLRQQLLNLVRQNTSSDVLNLCELTIWPHNVGIRDVQLAQLYQMDVSASGVLKRVEQVLSLPLFLSGPIDFERQSGPLPGSNVIESKLVVQKFKLYHVVYYSKLD